MVNLRSLVLALSVLVVSRLPHTSCHQQQQDDAEQERQGDLEIFQQLLQQVDPTALHAALHNLSPHKFKHGAFHHDTVAAEAIHRDNPRLATDIVSLARRAQATDLSNNSSVVITPPSSENNSPPPPPSTSTIVIPPTPSSTVVVITTTPPPSPSRPVQPSQASEPSEPSEPSQPTQPSEPTSPGPVIGPSSSSAAAAQTSSSAAAQASSSAAGTPGSAAGSGSGSASISTQTESSAESTPPESSAAASSAPGEPSTSAPATEASSTPSSRPPNSKKTSVVLQTLTLPNGAQSTITAVTLVGGEGGAASTSAPPGPSRSSPNGSLQSEGAAPKPGRWRWEALGALGGAMGFAVMF